MRDQSKQLVHAHEVSTKVARLYEARTRIARERFIEQIKEAWERNQKALEAGAARPWEWWQGWGEYAVDFAQRSVLFWDTLRQRGNNYVAHERAGKPPASFTLRFVE